MAGRATGSGSLTAAPRVPTRQTITCPSWNDDVMSLAEFVDDVREREKTLTVFSDDETIVDELRDFFEVQNISVRRGTVEGAGPDDFVVLHQEGAAVAVSTLADVRESLFLGGAVGRSGSTRGLQVVDVETPDVIASLGNTTFTAEGDDDLLLSQISHYIADLAFRTGAGAVHTGPHRIAAVDGARTQNVDRKLIEAGVQLHVYGDGETHEEAILHGVDTEEVESTRFVVYDGDGDDAYKAALVATTENGDYRGFWTFEARIVDEILGYLRGTYGGQ